MTDADKKVFLILDSLRVHHSSRVQMRTKDKLKEATKAHMDMLDQHPERVRSYFNDPKIKYAS